MIHTLSVSRAVGLRLGRFFAFTVVLGIGMLASVRPAAAHGGEETLQLDRIGMGPYRLSASTYPALLSVGKVQISVAVREAQSDIPARHCKVLVQLEPLEEKGVLYHFLSASYPTIRHPLYDFEVDLATPGRYRVIVQLQDSSGWAGETSFEIMVYAELKWLKWLIIASLVQAGLFGIWLGKDAMKVWGGRRWEALEKT